MKIERKDNKMVIIPTLQERTFSICHSLMILGISLFPLGVYLEFIGFAVWVALGFYLLWNTIGRNNIVIDKLIGTVRIERRPLSLIRRRVIAPISMAKVTVDRPNVQEESRLILSIEIAGDKFDVASVAREREIDLYESALEVSQFMETKFVDMGVELDSAPVKEEGEYKRKGVK